MRACMLGACGRVVQNGIGEAHMFLLTRAPWAESMDRSIVRACLCNLVPGVIALVAPFFPSMPYSIITPGSVALKYPNILGITISPVVLFCVGR